MVSRIWRNNIVMMIPRAYNNKKPQNKTYCILHSWTEKRFLNCITPSVTFTKMPQWTFLSSAVREHSYPRMMRDPPDCLYWTPKKCSPPRRGSWKERYQRGSEVPKRDLKTQSKDAPKSLQGPNGPSKGKLVGQMSLVGPFLNFWKKRGTGMCCWSGYLFYLRKTSFFSPT